MEAPDFLKTEPRDYLEAREFSQTEGNDFPENEKSKGTYKLCSAESTLFGAKSEKDDISSRRRKSIRHMRMCRMRMRDFVSLLLSYPVRIFHDHHSHLASDNIISRRQQLRRAQGLVPKEILRAVEDGEGSIIKFDRFTDIIPEAILSLAADLAVHQLIQTLVSICEHQYPQDMKYIRLSTRSDIEKRAVAENIEAALIVKHRMLDIRNSFRGTLSVDASMYPSTADNQFRKHVCQLLQLPMIEDDDILCTRLIEEEMSRNRYLVLVIDRDGEEMLDPQKVGFCKTKLSGVMVLITAEAESSTENEDEDEDEDELKLKTEMDLEIRTKDHLLPWEVFCHNVGSEVVYSSSPIQSIAVRIVKGCRGHLLAVVLVAKWLLRNVRDVKHWELALDKMLYTNPSYDIQGHLSTDVMINAFINFVWDGVNKTLKRCLVRCLFIPNIKDVQDDHELMNDWISSLFMDADEARNNLRQLVGHCALLPVKAVGDGVKRYIRMPEETYDIVHKLHNLNPMLINKGGEVIEVDTMERWHSAVQIELVDIKLSELPVFPNWPDLTVLVLQGNADLTKISPSFFDHMPLLQILDLSYTSVRELPGSFFNLDRLRELYLKGCECFMKLPPEIGKLQKLEKLDLEETQIIHLPEEFQQLTNMQSLILYFHEYRGKKNKPYSCSTIIPSGVISKLKGLKHLNIDVNPDDERWHENVQVILPEILGLERLRTLSLYIPQLKLLKLIPSRILEADFRFIVGCHMQRIISSVPPTVDAKFKQSDCSLKYIKGVDVPSEIKMLLRNSKALFLDRHMTLKNLSEFEMKNLEQLRVCILSECREMQTIVDGRTSNGNNDMLSRLLFLSVSHTKKLRSIWEGPPPPRCFFGMLQSLSLQSCPRLTTLFSLDFVGNLSLLREIIVKDCPKLSSLMSYELSKVKEDIFLPKLRKLSLVHLPELISISNGLRFGPHLQEMGFYDCPKFQSFSRKELSSPKLMVIRGETKWRKGLKWCAEEWGKAGPPSRFTSTFSPISEEADVMAQLGIDNDDVVDGGDGPGGFAGEPSESTEVATPVLKSPALSNKVSRVKKQKYVDENINDGPGWSEAEPLHPTGVASRILKSPTLKNHTYNDDDLNNDPGTSGKELTSMEEMRSRDLVTNGGLNRALQLQMKLQKLLHEQLQIQRKWQIQVVNKGSISLRKEMSDSKAITTNRN